MRTRELILADEADNVVIKAYHSMLPPQSRAYQAHHHTECELSFFFRGSGVYRMEDRCCEFRAGDVFLFGSNEAHCITEIREDMDLALEARNKLLQTVLHGEPALERWETLGQYAEAAGVTRKSLEKEAKVAALKEKLKFWKYLKKIK